MSSPNTDISTLETERQQNLDRAQTIFEVARDSDGRDLTTEEQGSQDKYLDRVEQIDRELNTLGRIEALQAARAAKAEPSSPEPSGIEVGDKHREPGMLFAQMAVALHRAGGNRREAAIIAREQMDDVFLSRVFETPANELRRSDPGVGNTVSAAWAGDLVREYDRQSGEFIDLLRAQTLLGTIGARMLSFAGAPGIKIPRQTAGASGTWLDGEASAIPVKALAFDAVNLTPKKMGTITVVSRELIERSDPSALSIIRDDLVASAATAMDQTFCGGSAAGSGSPAGIFNGSSTLTASNQSNTLTDATADMLSLLSKVAGTEQIPGPFVWAMNTLLLTTLQFMRDANGAYAFRDELNSGMLAGYPVVVSDAAASADRIMLLAPNQILVANGMAPTLDLSTEATIHRETVPADNLNAATPVQSLWQTDSVGFRMLLETDWGKRHAWAAAVIGAVNWA